MLEQIKALEEIARKLEVSSEEWQKINKDIYNYSTEFIESLPQKKAFISEDMSAKLEAMPIPEEPVSIENCLANFDISVNTSGINPASGGHLGYIPGGGIPVSALGDYLASITNRYAGVFFASPGAVRMENFLLKWFAQIVGYPASSFGNLASGGSIANLIAIVTARKAHELKARDFERAVVYLSSFAHHSIEKAIRVAGMEECELRFIDVDAHYRMRTDSLEKAIIEDNRNQKIPWLVVSAAGNTDTGMVDPIGEIGNIAEKYNLWHHIDAAYGGFFVLIEECKQILGDLHISNSIVMDPHKGLFLPYGTGAVLVKDQQHMVVAHNYHAHYMQDALDENTISPADVSPELSRHFRGLRLWLPLQLLGLRAFRAGLEEKLLLARYFYGKIKSINGMEVGPYPDLSVVIFRYIPKNGCPNKFNQNMLKYVHQDGRIFISSTLIETKFTLRLAVLSFRTHVDHIDILLEIITNYIAASL